MSESFAELETLHLTSFHEPRGKQATENLAKLIASATKLTDLALDFAALFRSVPTFYNCNFVESASPDTVLPATTCLRFLTQLRLLGFTAHESGLISFIKRHAATLRDLSIDSARLIRL